MPEEVNRIVTDRLADLLTPSRDANENLRAEGMSGEKIHLSNANPNLNVER